MDRSLSRRFGLLLALHRMRAGLSQEECGRVVGLHRTELSLLEAGWQDAEARHAARSRGCD
ncbi:MAG TPA: helix-turn-helix domain-containing protein [Solirubrobacterales bacterium]|jgi:hypothetical protein|nr:helix-turn-helix domain-containing protein [Solirubrobacterales bacterium]